MTDPRDESLDTLVEQLKDAGLVESYTDPDGREVHRLTPEGKRVAHQLAKAEEAGQDELLQGLIEGEE